MQLTLGRLQRFVTLSAWVALCFISIAPAGAQRIVIVTGKEPPALEQYAAEELKAILERLFRVQVGIEKSRPQSADWIILLGQHTTNPQIAKAANKNWPALSDQGLMLKTVDAPSPTLVVYGGSPIATLWAVYELGERLGIRYLCDRDIYPAPEPPEWKPLPKLDVVMEPNLRIRCWRLLNEHAMGPISWSLDENRRFLKQIVKMKFNRVHLFVWPAQPFVDYSFRGTHKAPGIFFLGWRFPIDDRTLGRERFGKMTEFTNPEFVGVNRPDELHQQSVNLARGIIEAARDLGLETDLSFFPTEWPKEFLASVPGAQPYRQAGNLTCGPGPESSVDDPALRDMVTTVVRAHVETYPNVDFVRLSLPEHAAWLSQAETCYNRLRKRYDLSALGSFEELCTRARSHDTFPGGGQRVERWVKESLVVLYLLDQLVNEHGLLKRPGGGSDIRLSLKDVPDELYPLIAQQFPKGSEVVSFIDYTASRQLQQPKSLRQPRLKNLDRLLTLTLADDNVGVLPQLAGGSIHKLLQEIRAHQWSGYTIRYWTVGEQDPVVHFLARASWQPDLTPQEAYADQVSHLCGGECVASAQKAFASVEEVTKQLDQHGLGFAFPTPDMMQQHAKSCQLAEPIRRAREQYRQAAAAMQEAGQQSRPAGRFYTDYFAARLQFAIRYLDACEEYGKATSAQESGDLRSAAEHAERAAQAIREAIASLVPVIRDHGELGAIAVLNEFCRKPIYNLSQSLSQPK